MEFSFKDEDFADAHTTRTSGSKRSFGDRDEDGEDEISRSKNVRSKLEEAAPGAATGMILSLRESLQNCKDDVASCQNETESAKTEIQKWKSAFQNESFIPAGKSPEARFLVDFVQNLKSSERSLKEQLEITKRKEASCIVQYAKREHEMAELKSAARDLKSQLKPASMQARRLLLNPAIHEEFSRLKKLVEEKDKKIKELQDNIAAVTFTPQSKMGELLRAKCKTLQEENEEIGHQADEGKVQELAIKLTMQKSQNAELRSQCEGLFKHMEELTNDVERSKETVMILQEKLKEKEKGDRESKERDGDDDDDLGKEKDQVAKETDVGELMFNETYHG